ncbi:BrnT family toxin [soil metagenome]
MRYNFEWDDRKAKANLRKHNVGFELAATIFRDPNLLSVPDEEHSESEERLITIGLDETQSLLVLVHKLERADQHVSIIRIISARKATKGETKTHEKGI